MFFLIPFFNLSFSLVLTFFFCLFCFMHFFFNFSQEKILFCFKSRFQIYFFDFSKKVRLIYFIVFRDEKSRKIKFV